MAGHGAGDQAGSQNGQNGVPGMIQEMDKMLRETEEMEERLINMEIETVLNMTDAATSANNFNLFLEQMRQRIEELEQTTSNALEKTLAKAQSNGKN